MANGDPLWISTWDERGSGYVEWVESVTAGGTFSHDTGQSVPDGSAACLKALHNSSGDLLMETDLTWNATGHSTGCISFWFKGTTNLTAGLNEDIVNVFRSSNTGRNWRLYFDTAGALRLGFWTTNSVTSNITTITSGWHYIQVAWDFSTTTNKLTLAVDGAESSEYTYTATNSVSLNTIQLGNQIAAADSATSTKYYGPVVFTEGYHIPQEMKVKCLRPTSDVNSNWATTGANRWSVVDDAPDDDATYISSTTINQTQTLGMGDVTLSAGETILGVQPTTRTAVGPFVNGQVSVYIQDSGSTNSAQLIDANTSSSGPFFVLSDRPLLLDPDGAAWTESVLNGCRTHLNQTTTADSRVSEISWRVAISAPGLVSQALTATLSFTSAQTRKRIIKNIRTATMSFTGALGAPRAYRTKAFNATLTLTTNATQFMWRQLQDAGGWFVKRGRVRRRKPY
jgi:hypothetical protein